MKRFHFYGSTEYKWTLQVSAETEEEAKNKCRNLVFDGDFNGHEQEVSIDGCDEEEGYYEEE
jgi:hypothetical protein